MTPRTYVSAGLEDAEVPLLGGDMTEGVVRVGRTVRRPVRPHTAAVHGLLRHLEAAGFDGAPRVLGIDAKNREALTYLPGVVARRPLPAFATADSTLAALARLQLCYHEAVAGFEPAPGARWDGEVTRFVDGPVDIICHCDINLENVIFQPGPDGLRPYALIDFDLARPGTRLVDIIQTLRYWAPIADPADRDPALRDVDVAARIAIFCEAYGLSYTERARLVPVASRWLRRSRATIAQRARMRGGAWTRMVDVGVGERLLRSAVWLERNQPEIEARLCHPIGPSQPADLPSQPAGLSRPAGPPPPASQPASQPVGPRQPARRPVPAGTAVPVSEALIGDPRRGHPVAAFGRGAAKLETRMYADERFRGALDTSACVLAAALPAVAAHRLTRHRPLLRGAAVTAVVWAVTGARSLTQEAERAAIALDTDDLETAQTVLPGLCSRDPPSSGRRRSPAPVVESVAENTSDAAVAPLVWAAFAGALGLRLGGINAYEGVAGQRPELGDGRPPEPRDIRRAGRLSRAVTISAAALAAAASLAGARR